MAITINLSAQTSTTYFAKPVELETVPASVTKSDSVLVRGANRIIKYVPRSEFGGGTGTTPTINQVLTAGNESNTAIVIKSEAADLVQTSLDIGTIEFRREPAIGDKSFGFLDDTHLVFGNDESQPSTTTYDKSGLRWDNGLSTASTTLDFANRTSLGDVFYKFDPEKEAGEYLIATENNISLQRMMTTGQNDGQIPNATDPDTFYKDRVLLGHDFGAWSYDAGSGSGGTGYLKNSYVSNAQSGGGSQIGSVFKYSSAENGLYSFVQSQDGVIYLKTAINDPDNEPSGITQLIIQTPVFGAGESIYELKSKDIPGTYEIATTDQIKLKSYTVATLPAGVIGDVAYVTDATSPTYLGNLTGGGAVKCPVFYNGSAWVSY
ncbi:MAG: hypothetical protein ABIP27_16550 [Flavobacterium circumlabens]|uniref:hypothetical protein n=1 Tax=Flavobacterium circumlabens TaxID=2133765 RepID=UPI003266FF58